MTQHPAYTSAKRYCTCYTVYASEAQQDAITGPFRYSSRSVQIGTFSIDVKLVKETVKLTIPEINNNIPTTNNKDIKVTANFFPTPRSYYT